MAKCIGCGAEFEPMSELDEYCQDCIDEERDRKNAYCEYCGREVDANTPVLVEGKWMRICSDCYSAMHRQRTTGIY